MKAYRRFPFLELNAEIQSLTKQAGHALSFAELCCDRLDYTDGAVVSLGDTSLVIFSRLCFQSSEGPLILDCQGSQNLHLRIYSASLPPGFNVKIMNLAGTASRVVPVAIAEGKRGVRLSKTVSSSDVQIVDIERPEPEDLILDDALAPSIVSVFKNDNVVRLLRYQLLLATVWMMDDPTTAISILQWITGITAKSSQPAAVELYFQCCTVLSRMSISNGLASFYTPSLDLSVCEKDLSARLTAALAFETSFEAFMNADVTSTNFGNSATLALQKSGDMDSEYTFLAALAKQRYHDAKACLQEARSAATFLSNDLPSLGSAFEQGVKDWKQEQNISAAITGIFTIIELAASIAAIAAMGPAGAPAAGAGAKAAGDEMKSVIDLHDFLETFTSLIEKIAEMTDYIQHMTDLASSFQTLDSVDGANLSDPATVSNPDMVIAGWDSFRDKVNAMFSEIPTKDIKHAAGYQQALLDLATLGKAVVACQKAVVQTGDEYVRTEIALKTSQNDSDRLLTAVAALTTQEAVLSAFKDRLFSRLLTSRTWLFMDYQQYVAAYMYFALEDQPPISMSPTKAASEYAVDAATLQDAVGAATVRWKSQIDNRIVFSTDDPISTNVFDDAWKDALVSTQKIVFKVSPNDKRFARYTRVRLHRIRFFFEVLQGEATAKASSVVTVHISLAPQIIDRGPKPSFQLKSYFLMDKIEMDFAYFQAARAGDEPRIKVDGVFVDADKYFRATPFTEWTIEVVDSSLDLSAVTGAKLELECGFS
ncbi:hypothetical protein LTR17_023238 [Elasticomyces elasticus]|nr:hypothetical protein LTR17_023238 [Elasticomyces elasticus]